MMRHRQPEFVKIAGPCKFTSRLQVSIGKDSIVQQQSCFPYPLSLFDIDVKSVLKRNDGDVSGILAPGAGSLRKQALMQINDHALPQCTLRGEHTLDAEVREQLTGGTLFNLLDVTGGWAWGQVGEDGFVGYLPIEALEA